MSNYSFTQTEILTAIANWSLEPFTLEELNFLLKKFTFTDYPKDNADISYGENNIESLILETLSEMDIEEQSQESFIEDLESYITKHPYFLEIEGTKTNLDPSEDRIEFETHDLDGDYERVIITIDLIP